MAEELGARIRDLRIERGLTQRELAEPRYSRGFLAAVESGHREPTDEVLIHVAAQLGVDPVDLRYGRPAGVEHTLREGIDEVRRRLSRGDDDYAQQAAAAIEADAGRYHLPALVCLARVCTGDVLLHRGDPGAALAEFHRAAEVATSRVQRAETTHRISLALFLTGQTAASVEVAERELQALHVTPPADPEAQLRLMTALIYPYLEIGAVERARRVVQDGLELLPRVGERAVVASFHAVASQVWHRQGRLSEVDASLEAARRIFTELGMEREIGRCHWMRGYALVRLDRLDEAAAELVRARQIFTEVRARHFFGGATAELAEVRRRQGDLDAAESLCREAAQIVEALGYAEGIAETDRLLGRIAIARGERESAEALLSRALERYAEAGLNNDVMHTSRELGELLSEQDRWSEAVAVLRRGVSSVAKID